MPATPPSARRESSWLSFFNYQNLVDGDVLQHLSRAARPQDLYLLNDLRLSKAEVKSCVVAAQVTCNVVDLSHLRPIGCLQLDRRAQAEPVALFSLRPNDDPVARPRAEVF